MVGARLHFKVGHEFFYIKLKQKLVVLQCLFEQHLTKAHKISGARSTYQLILEMKTRPPQKSINNNIHMSN